MGQPSKSIDIVRAADDSISVLAISGENSELVLRRMLEIVSDRRSNGSEVIDVTAGVDDVEPALRAANQSFMFADSAVVVLRDSSKLSQEERALAQAVIEQGVSPNMVIFLDLRPMRSVSGGSEGSDGPTTSKDTLFELIKKVGKVETVATPSGKAKQIYVESLLDASGLRLTNRALEMLSTHLGDAPARADAIVSVLLARHGEGATLDVSEIVDYLGEHGEVPMWDLTDAIEKGDQAGALEVLKTIFVDAGRDPVILISVLAKRLSELAAISSCSAKNPEAVNSALRRAGLLSEKGTKHPYVVKKMIPVAQLFGVEDYKVAFGWVQEADLALRGEPIMPKEICLEVMVTRLSALYRRKINMRAASPQGSW